jgi:hypothetical protein
MAFDSAPCGAAGLFFGLKDEGREKKHKAMLAYKEMSSGPKKTMSGLGVPGWRGLLDHQWHDLRRHRSKGLE